MYKLAVWLVPFIRDYSSYVSGILFIWWLIKKRCKWYRIYLDTEAKRRHITALEDISNYNLQNQTHRIELNSGWLDIHNNLIKRINNTLLLSLVFAYLSFNASSYFENTNEDFFKFLTISTTIFLAGITYIRE